MVAARGDVVVPGVVVRDAGVLVCDVKMVVEVVVPALVLVNRAEVAVRAVLDVAAVDVSAAGLEVSCIVEGTVVVVNSAVVASGVEELVLVVSGADVAGVAVVDVCIGVEETVELV